MTDNGPAYALGYRDGYDIGHRVARARVRRQLEALCAEWDELSKGETATTRAIRERLTADLPYPDPL